MRGLQIPKRSEITPNVSPFVSVSWWPFCRGIEALMNNCQERILKSRCSWCHKIVNCHYNEFKQLRLMQTCCIPAFLLGNDPNACCAFPFPLLCHLRKNSHSIIFFPSLIYPLLVSERKKHPNRSLHGSEKTIRLIRAGRVKGSRCEIRDGDGVGKAEPVYNHSPFLPGEP